LNSSGKASFRIERQKGVEELMQISIRVRNTMSSQKDVTKL